MIITIQKKKEKKTATGTAQNLQTKSSLNGYLNKLSHFLNSTLRLLGAKW